MIKKISTIGLDADDTLWHNENIFEDHHKAYCELLSEYHDADTIEEHLFETEMKNLEIYGYGIKSFTLSSIETAISLTEGKIDVEEIHRLIKRCKDMLNHPVELLDGVSEVVQELSRNYHLLLITKGDLRDQERKIARSGLAHCFDHIEVVSDKKVENYARVLQRNQISTKEFIMVGNSIKSDCLPILDLGGHAVHIPYRLTWQHERVQNPPTENERFFELKSIKQFPNLLKRLTSES